jgi:hypothetical protein
MRKLLGQVSVYLDNASTDVSSHIEAIERGKTYEIVLTPQVDKDEMEYRGIPYHGISNTATTLAHEFGHLIGELLHTSAAWGSNELAGEKEAWNLAEIANPHLEKQQEKAALGTYE